MSESRGPCPACLSARTGFAGHHWTHPGTDRTGSGANMIQVTELNGSQKYVNCGMIEVLETVPETMIVLASGRRHLVKETPETVIERVIEFHRRCAVAPPVIERD